MANGKPITTRIICIGNRYVPGDDLGSKVYDRLKETGLPDGVEVIEGGLAGLDLLRFIEGAARIVFVDAVCGFSKDPSEVVCLDRDALMNCELSPHFGHSAGVPYLVQAIPAALGSDGPLPELFLLGAEKTAAAGNSSSSEMIDSLAGACLQLAMGVR